MSSVRQFCGENVSKREITKIKGEGGKICPKPENFNRRWMWNLFGTGALTIDAELNNMANALKIKIPRAWVVLW
jgi:hypothetical protein